MRLLFYSSRVLLLSLNFVKIDYDLQKENSDKTSDTVVLADIHVPLE